MNAATVCVICDSVSLQSFIIFVCEAVLDTVHFPRELSRTSLLSSASQARCSTNDSTALCISLDNIQQFMQGLIVILLGLNHLQ